MNPDLTKHIASVTPDLNMDLAGGLATAHMEKRYDWIEKVMRSAEAGFPKELKYTGYRICTPQEKYQAAIKTRKPRRPRSKQQANTKNGGGRQYETAQTDFSMIELMFTFNGEALQKRYLYVPFSGPAGGITISDTKWYISPVLADRVISIGVHQIFVRLLRDRLTFSREMYPLRLNGVRIQPEIVFSSVYHKSKDKDKQPKNQARTSMVHYLFCKYGFQNAMQKYANCTPVVGENITTVTHPESEWDIYSSMEIMPKTLGRRSKVQDYQPTRLKVAIRKNENNEQTLQALQYREMTEAMVAGFFYVADHFPGNVQAQYVMGPEGWIAPMGYMLLPENINRGKIEEGVNKHLSSLDYYADPIVVENLREIDIHIENIYDFFAYIARDFGKMISNNQDRINSMYDKELIVLYYVLYDITSAIFNLFFALKANSKKVTTKNDVEKALNDNLKAGLAYALSKSHGEVASTSYSGDNKALKPTSTLVPQTSTNKLAKRGSDRGTMSDPSRTLHPSQAEIASINTMRKPEPTGRDRANHFALLSADKRLIQRNPRFQPLLDYIAAFQLTSRTFGEQSTWDEDVASGNKSEE